MKKTAIALASLFAVAVPAAHAAYDRNGNYYEPYQPGAHDSAPMSRTERLEFARVIDSRPVYASGEREECWNPRSGVYEASSERNNDRSKGTVAGAVVGGVIGHQIDSGAGGTIGGALLGGLIGNQIEKSRNENPSDNLDHSRCRQVAQGSGDLLGYDVRYEYRGRQYTARLDHQPPRRLRVGQDIRDDGEPF